MRKLFIFLIFLFPSVVFAQGSHFDSAVITSATNVPIGAQAPLYTYPFSVVTICGYPASTTSATCTNKVTIYSDAGLTITTPNPVTADAQGKFGFWISSGNYSYSITSPTGKFLGSFIFSLGGGGAGSGTVTEVSGVDANGFTVDVANVSTTPQITVGVDATHVLPVNTGPATSYLNQAGGYSTPAGGISSFQGRTAAAAVLTTADVGGLGALPNSITGNSGTTSAFNHTPALCASGFAPNGITSTGAAAGCAAIGGPSGFPFMLGTTPITPSSTTAGLDGVAINGVSLTTAGVPTEFLDATGAYSVPPGGGAAFPSVGTPCIVTATSPTVSRCSTAADVAALGPLSNDTTGNAATASALGDQYYGNTLYIFGDSIAAGVGSDLYQNSFAGILQASHAGPTINNSQGGNQSTDVAINVIGTIAYDPTVTTGPPSILMPMGLNNYNGCGFTVDCQAIYAGSTNAAVAWAGMTPGQGNRVMASAMTVDGTFSTDSSDYALPVVVSTTNGGVASWSITSTGNPIGIYYVVSNSNGGVMSCKVDSGSPTSINLFPTSPAVIGANHSYTFYRTELAAAAGSHTVSCTGTSTTGAGNRVALLASDTIPVGASPTTLPKIVMTNVEGIDGSNGAAAIAFNTLAASVESGFATQGLNIVLADINTGSNSYGINGYSPTNPQCPTNSDPSSQSGGLHPNKCGHWGIAQSIITATPKSLIYNTGKESGAIQRLGVPVRSVLDYTTWNLGAGFSMTSLNSGGLSLYPGRVVDLGAFTGQRIEASSVGNPYTRATDGFCFANSNAGATQQSDFVPRACYNAGHFFFWTSSNALPSGSITQTVIHPWTMSRENQSVINNASPILPTNADIAYVGPLTSNVSLPLTQCNNDPSVAFSHNYRYELYRIGNDGFSLTFTMAAGGIDTINGGTSYTWTASEPGKLELQCSETAVGGTYWYAVPYGGSAGGGFANPMTGVGDFIAGGTAGTATRLAAFTVAGTYNICETPTGSPAAPTWCSSPKTLTAVANNFLTSYDASTGTYTQAALTATNIAAAGTLSNSISGNAATATTAASATQATNVAGGTLGSVHYQSAANTTAMLPGNITAVKQFFCQTGTGTVSAAPAWCTPTLADIAAGTAVASSGTFNFANNPITTTGMGTFSGITVNGTNFTQQTSSGSNSGLVINNVGASKTFDCHWDATPTLQCTIGAANHATLTGIFTFAQGVISNGTVTSTLGTAAITSATPAAGVTSVTCQTANCDVYGGTYTVVGGTGTTGTFVTLLWPTTTTAWRCEVSQNGGAAFLGLGHSVATATGMTVSSGVTIASTTFTFDYNCQP